MRRSAQMTTQLLVFPLGPTGQRSIQLPHRRIERRPVKPPVILEPSTNDRVNIRDKSSMDLSLRRCRFQLRISVRIAFTALSETAGLKLMKNFPLTPAFGYPPASPAPKQNRVSSRR